MRDVVSRLLKLGLPALVLAVAMLTWVGAVQAGTTGHPMDGAHSAMPCHEQTAQAATGEAGHGKTAARPAKADHGGACPDCRCVAVGCAHVAAMPAAITARPVTFVAAPLFPRPAARLAAQANTGPPAEPPRS